MTKTGIAKLGDFGVSAVMNNKSKASSVCGTPHYISPEIYLNEPYNYEVDIWALGVLLYELCTLKYPFNGRTAHEIAKKVVVG